MFIHQSLEQNCELCILLNSADLWPIVQGVKGVLVAVIDPLDVWVVDNYIWQKLQIHEPSSKPFW